MTAATTGSSDIVALTTGRGVIVFSSDTGFNGSTVSVKMRVYDATASEDSGWVLAHDESGVALALTAPVETPIGDGDLADCVQFKLEVTSGTATSITAYITSRGAVEKI